MTPFLVLAEPVRYRIVEILCSGEHESAAIATAVMREFSVSRSAVSHHLRILRAAGWLRTRIEDGRRLHRLESARLEDLDDAVDRLRELWDQRTGFPYLTDPLGPSRSRRPGLPRDPWRSRDPDAPHRAGVAPRGLRGRHRFGPDDDRLLGDTMDDDW